MKKNDRGGNTMYRIGIVEDDEKMANELIQYLKRFEKENGLSLEIWHFPDGAKLVGEYHPVWDLLLLDIDMPVMDGITTAKCIRKQDMGVIIMFITNLAQYAIKGYEVNAIDYVLKPVNYYALVMKLKKVVRMLEAGNDKSLLLKRGSDVVRVLLSHVFYLEILNHSLYYRTMEGDIVLTGSHTLAKMEEELKPHGFVRCHNGFLVNLRYVDEIRGGSLMLAGRAIPISRNRRRAVMDALFAYAKENLI